MSRGRWKVQTVEEYGKDLKKKVWELETLEEFKAFLNELSDSTFGLVFYSPLAEKFDELYAVYKWAYRLIFAVGVILAAAFGYCLALLLGGWNTAWTSYYVVGVLTGACIGAILGGLYEEEKRRRLKRKITLEG